MKVSKTKIPGVMIIEPAVYQDKRGYFFESYNEQIFSGAGIDYRFVQDNQSKSSYGVIRGLHMQNAPHAQTKLIRVIGGSIFDVAVDLRKGSATFGEWFGMELSAENNLQMVIPRGCCHGFSVLSEIATVLYKCDDFYHPETERGIRFNDPDLQIDWRIPENKAKVSEKDLKLPFLENFKK